MAGVPSVLRAPSFQPEGNGTIRKGPDSTPGNPSRRATDSPYLVLRNSPLSRYMVLPDCDPPLRSTGSDPWDGARSGPQPQGGPGWGGRLGWASVGMSPEL